MAEETFEAIHQASSGTSRMRTSPRSAPLAPVLPGDFDGRAPAVPPLVRQLASPLVRLFDQASLCAALFATAYSFAIHHDGSLGSFLQLRISVHNLLAVLALLLTWRLIFWLTGLYHPRLTRTLTSVMVKVPLSAALCTLVAVLPLHTGAQHLDPITSACLFWFLGCSLMLATRVCVYTYEENIRPAFRKPRTVLICGTGMRARSATLELPDDREFRYHLEGYVDSTPQPECDGLAPYLGHVSDLEMLLMRLPVDEVLIALPIKSHFNEIEQIINVCGRGGIEVQYSLDLFTAAATKHHHVGAGDGNRVVLEMVHRDQRLLVKNIFDRILASLGLLILAPVLLLIALAVKLTSNGPVFFIQQRYGLGKRMFGMIKFRSMVVDAEARQAALEHLNENDGPTFKIKQDPRVTKVGSFLRKTSLDELPQLFNVVKGEMSLVGPRPLPERDVRRFSEAWLMRRFSVKPGITGLWQVSGRSLSDFDNLIKLDLRYIDRWSLLLDIKILLRTFSAVVRRRGAY
ncbi:exopolysaccharide biosynthesis polyprenyl glycosylphosphotransferase [Bryocella elongata]|uniref:Exopolysaccharide biosynthesis polyprenyl glycosylphosphotransferase n=1 Tax=Bryocella elongata TaxID=863522 RepID=A0A1H5WFI5_9BACT|nr:sugar transferase [Bryocella elongata]SEF98128.1 exopolysaccharide biosynthesis polyprenyl glycosylphosphotransferase [Bryocella elongata]